MYLLTTSHKDYSSLILSIRTNHPYLRCQIRRQGQGVQHQKNKIQSYFREDGNRHHRPRLYNPGHCIHTLRPLWDLTIRNHKNQVEIAQNDDKSKRIVMTMIKVIVIRLIRVIEVIMISMTIDYEEGNSDQDTLDNTDYIDDGENLG